MADGFPGAIDRSNDEPSQANSKRGNALRPEGERKSTDGTRIVAGERVEVERFSETADDESSLGVTKAGMQRARCANEGVRNAGRLVTENQGVAETRTPPEIPGTDADRDFVPLRRQCALSAMERHE